MKLKSTFYAITQVVLIIVLPAIFADLQPIKLQVINEEVPPGTLVASLSEELSQQGFVLTAGTRFMFYGKQSAVKKLFNLNETTGEIKTSIRIDRDSLCTSSLLCCSSKKATDKEICNIDFNVKIKENSENIRLYAFVISIKDINDNPPKFPTKVLYRNIKENLAPGVSISLPQANDLDAGPNSISSYKITGQTSSGKERHQIPAFKLQTDIKSGIIRKLSLVSLQSFDREKNNLYIVNVTAYDGDLISATLTIMVTITDDNDCEPVFINVTPLIRIKENVQLGTILTTMKAEDCDSGSNGKISYSLAQSNSRLIHSTFSIDSNTGELSNNIILDHETSSEYQILIIARDNSPVKSMMTETLLTVKVEDVNDNKPSISIEPESRTGRIEVPENEKPMYVVATIAVSDPDVGDNGRAYCQITEGEEYFQLESLQLASVYSLKATRSFDREDVSQYHVTVECTDTGSDPKKSREQFTVYIVDINDNKPVFQPSGSSYQFRVHENNPIGQTIGRIWAKDQDTGINGNIFYSLHPESQQYVNIDSRSGQLSAKVAYDRERMDRFLVNVIASDKPNPQKGGFTETATVTIWIVDANDNAPVFDQASLQPISVREDIPTRTMIAEINATDADVGHNGNFRFHLIKHNQYFQLTSEGGLSIRRKLDREREDHYTLLIQVQDRGNPSLSSTATLEVNVLDVNDNKPRFIFPSPKHYSANVSLDFVPGNTITRVVATDLDTGNNSRIRYRIIPPRNFSGNRKPLGQQKSENPHSGKSGESQTESLFLLEEKTGELKLNRHLSGERTTYMLQLEARDSGVPEKKETRLLLIKIVSSSLEGQKKVRFAHQNIPNIVIILVTGLAVLVIIILFLIAIFLISKRIRGPVTRNHQNKNVQKMASYDEITLHQRKENLSATINSTRSMGDGGLTLECDKIFLRQPKRDENSCEQDSYNLLSKSKEYIEIEGLYQNEDASNMRKADVQFYGTVRPDIETSNCRDRNLGSRTMTQSFYHPLCTTSNTTSPDKSNCNPSQYTQLDSGDCRRTLQGRSNDGKHSTMGFRGATPPGDRNVFHAGANSRHPTLSNPNIPLQMRCTAGGEMAGSTPGKLNLDSKKKQFGDPYPKKALFYPYDDISHV